MPIVILCTMPTKAPYIQCSVLDHEVPWAFLGFCIGGKPRDVHGHWCKPNFYLDCIQSCCRDGHMPIVILCTMPTLVQMHTKNSGSSYLVVLCVDQLGKWCSHTSKGLFAISASESREKSVPVTV